MSYATSGDAIKYTGRSQMVFSPSSPMTTDDILEIVEDIDAEINGMVLGLGVALPVDETLSPLSYKLLKTMNAYGAAALIELRLFGDAKPGDAGNARYKYLQEKYDNLMQAIRDGEVLLSDTNGATITDADVGSATGKFDAEGNLVVPFFKRKDIF